MTTATYATSVQLDEDTVRHFEIPALLQQAGYTPTGTVVVASISYVDRAGQVVTVPTELMQMLDGDTLRISASGWADWFGSVDSFTLAVDNGTTVVLMQLQVVIDPVNDAPAGTDRSINLPNGSAYVLKEADFGFTDVADGHAFKSVLVSDPPAAGELRLNGVRVTAGTEVRIEDVRAGLLQYLPPAHASGTAVFGFQVRDAGGTPGVDLDATPNYISLCIPTSVLGDRVWLDANGNGVQDSTEAGLSGVAVTVRGAGADGAFGTADDTSASTVTNANGNYQFAGLQAGRYQLQVGSAASLVYSGRDLGGNDALDSDVDPNGATAVFTLTAGQTNLTLDAGVRALKASTLSGSTWVDANGNGVRDAGETGRAGVTVTARGAGLDGVFSTADDTVATTGTGTGGSYSLGGLANGRYQLTFGAPGAQRFTTQDVDTNDAVDSDVNAAGQSGIVTLGVRQGATVDAGLLADNGRIGDRVWHDANANGLQDATETGIAGIAITLQGAGRDGLFGTADDTSAATSTDSAGAYGFGGLSAGAYKVVFGQRAGLSFTSRDTGTNDALDSDADLATGSSQALTLSADQVVTHVDAGYREARTSTIGDRVWRDFNADGVQQATETGAAGVSVQLRGAGLDNVFGTADDVLASTTTGATGQYAFSALGAGRYQLTFGTLAGMTWTTQRAGTDGTLDSDAGANGMTDVFTLAAGSTATHIDAGLAALRTASIGDRVWLDANGNGLQDTGEAGVAGVSVSLSSAGLDGVQGTGDDVALATTSGANGQYGFGQLAAGSYTVGFGTPAGLKITGANLGGNDALDSDIDANGRATLTVAAGQAGGVDAGYQQIKTSTVASKVWNDANGNGLQDSAEAGVAGVAVTLRGAGFDNVFGNADDVLATTATDAYGNYRFANLAGGSFTLGVGQPAGYRFTQKDALANSRDAVDSDVNANGITDVFTLGTAASRSNVAAGVTELGNASIGNRVWLDADADGLQDAQEQGIAGALVRLVGKGADLAWGTADDLVRTTVTDAQGHYAFTGLKAGEYTVGADAPAGTRVTMANVGSDDTLDSDVSPYGPVLVKLAVGQQVTDVDIGFAQIRTGWLTGNIFIDGLGDGLKDGTEAGLADTTVTLNYAGFDGVFGTADDATLTTRTDAHGDWAFNTLAAGKYTATFGKPADHAFAPKDVLGNTRDALDSDANADGTTDVFSLAVGQSRTDISAGVVPPQCATIVGDFRLVEGYTSGFQVKLSTAMAYDTRYYVSAGGGTAGRTDTVRWDQKIAAGGGTDVNGVTYLDSYLDFTQTDGPVVMPVTGSHEMNEDYALFDTQGDIVGDAGGFYVTVKAGQLTSDTFSAQAWYETVYVDGDFLYGGVGFDDPAHAERTDYRETAIESFNLTLSAVDAGAVQVCEPQHTVSVVDNSQYLRYSPIVLDLDGNGIQTTLLAESTGRFDLLGTGAAIDSGWISAGDAFLAVDADGNGVIDDISELFGGRKGEGFAKLATFDGNADGVVDAADAAFSQLRVWQDADGDHATGAGELRTLAEAGIASLDTAYLDQAIEQWGNVLGEAGTATRSDGSRIDMVDVYFNVAATTAEEFAVAAGLPAVDSLLDGGNALLDAAFGAAADGGDATGVTDCAAWAEAGEATRQLLAAMRVAEGGVLASVG